jgi:hypothetical protein
MAVAVAIIPACGRSEVLPLPLAVETAWLAGVDAPPGWRPYVRTLGEGQSVRSIDGVSIVLAGGYVCPFVGWYTPDEDGGPNEYYKAGGHVISMVGIEGWCPSGTRQIKVRDPGNGDSNRLVQAAFSTNTYEMRPLAGFFASLALASLDGCARRRRRLLA